MQLLADGRRSLLIFTPGIGDIDGLEYAIGGIQFKAIAYQLFMTV